MWQWDRKMCLVKRKTNKSTIPKISRSTQVLLQEQKIEK